jgi:hypothetical protein
MADWLTLNYTGISGFHQKPLDENKPLSIPSVDFAKLAPFVSTISDGSWQFSFIGISSFG